MGAEVAILDMLASVDVNKHQLIEDEGAILGVIEVDSDDDDDVDEGVDLEADAGDHDGEGDESSDGADVPEEMVDMATCIRDLDICKTIDYMHIVCHHRYNPWRNGNLVRCVFPPLRITASRSWCNVHPRRRTFHGTIW
ncbi:hypothetical protein JTB14_007446 [Gonioctena quinquepunctata]|nr:hypothetical protein JTB14_007446 [Gonioctena quinquepunctata]